MLVDSGEQYVTITGMYMILKLFANSWDMAKVNVKYNFFMYIYNLHIIPNADATGYSNARYGPGSGSIVMDDVECRGTESRLYDCVHTSSHNCGHSEDASVLCEW